jgi:hypothetical protein
MTTTPDFQAEPSLESDSALDDLARTLDDVSTFVRRFVVITPAQADTVALWVAHTHAVEAADTTPYIAVTSAEKRSGKTRLLEALELLVHSPLPTANISDAALFRAINELHPTLLFDEVDAVFKSREREDLRGMLNAGYRRGAVAFRMGGKRMSDLESFEVYCAKAFAGIGDCLSDTIKDRAIPIRLQRRTREEPVERFRRREAQPEAEAIRIALERVLQMHVKTLKAARPDLPAELDDRAQDSWEPLLAIADAAGDEWATRARTAALALSIGEEREDNSLTAKLISDIYSVFAETGEERMRTADLIEHLSKIEESPWGDWYGKPITPHAVAKLLKAYRIKTMPVRVHGEKARGYKVEQFSDAFRRVLGGTSGTYGTSEASTEAACTTCTTCTALRHEEESDTPIEEESPFDFRGDDDIPF